MHHNEPPQFNCLILCLLIFGLFVNFLKLSSSLLLVLCWCCFTRLQDICTHRLVRVYRFRTRYSMFYHVQCTTCDCNVFFFLLSFLWNGWVCECNVTYEENNDQIDHTFDDSVNVKCVCRLTHSAVHRCICQFDFVAVYLCQFVIIFFFVRFVCETKKRNKQTTWSWLPITIQIQWRRPICQFKFLWWIGIYFQSDRNRRNHFGEGKPFLYTKSDTTYSHFWCEFEWATTFIGNKIGRFAE